jgi:hypothetical protein
MRSLNCKYNESKQPQVGRCRKSDGLMGETERLQACGRFSLRDAICLSKEWATRSGRTLGQRLGKNITINLGPGVASGTEDIHHKQAL